MTTRAVVYLVESGHAPGRSVLKVLRLPYAGEPMESLFPVLRIRHPGVVQAYGAGRGPDGLPYVFLEALEGETLRALIDREGPIASTLALDLAVDLAEAVAAIHGSGCVHGALSADCVFVMRGVGRCARLDVRLLDYRPVSTTRSRVDDPPSFPGTPVGPATDMHALGGVIYEAVAGVVPWHARISDTPARRMVPMPLTLLCPTKPIPPDLDDLVSRLVLPPAAGRTPSAAGVVARLRCRDSRRPSVAALTRTTGRFPTVESGLWPIGSVFRGPLREPVRLARRHEQPLLDTVLRDAVDGRGTVVWFQGEDGAGLTTLGQQFLDAARARGFATVLATAASPDLWSQVAGGLGFPPPGDDPSAFVESLVQTTTSTGTALFLDDFEVADSGAALTLDRVCRRIEDRAIPLVVLVASLPIAPAPKGDRIALHHVLGTVRGMSGLHTTAPLSDRDVDILVESMCPFPCDADIRARVRGVAGGNPLFVINYMAHLVDAGVLVERDGILAMVPGADPGLPADLATATSRRIRCLRERQGGEVALDLLTRVAILGQWADLDALQALLVLEGFDDRIARNEDALLLLVSEGFLRRISVPARELLVMTRPSDRELLVEDAEVSAWTELAAAHVLRSIHDDDLPRIAAELAGHYERAGFLDHGLDCRLLSANQAFAEGQYTVAGERYLRAEALLDRLGDPEDPRWEEVSAGLCEILILAGRLDDVERRLDRVHGRSGPFWKQRRLILGARLAQAFGRLGDAREVWSLVGATSVDPARSAEARLVLALMDLDDGRPDLARGRAIEVEALGFEQLSGRIQGLLLLVRGRLSASTGGVVAAFDLFSRALGALTAPSDLPDRSEALLERALLNLDLGHAEQAVEGFRTGVALCTMADYVAGLAGHLTGLGRALAGLGHDAEGRRAVVRAMGHRERLGAPVGVADGLVALAELAMNRRDLDTVKQLGTKVVGLLAEGGNVRIARQALLLLGLAALAADTLDEAGRHLQACLLTSRVSQDISVTLAEAHVALGHVRVRTGDRDSAKRHLLNAVVMFERLGLPLRAGGARALAAGE